MTRLHLDYETASEVDIKSCGAYKYAADPSTRILMLGWAIDDEPEHLWEPHRSPIPPTLWDALRDRTVDKHAFNAAFERLITRHCLGLDIPPEQWRCTMVESYYLGFAGGLDQILKAIGLQQKDDRGKRLINLFCTPAPKNHKATWYDYDNKPLEWQEFGEYCRQDVRVERQLYHWLRQFPQMNEWDYIQWFNDQRINDRGVPMDVDMAHAAIEIWDMEKENLTQTLRDMTGLPKVTREPFMNWIKDNTGVELESTRSDYIATLLSKGKLPREAEPYIDVWSQKEGKATSKYSAIINATGADGRARGMFQYKGASRTDRVGGRLIQLQNLKRPIYGDTPEQIDTVVNAIKCRDPRFLSMLYPTSVSETLGGAIRHALCASEGHLFAVCDLTSIESVILGWVSMCPAIDDTFRQGKDSYKMFASKYYGIPYEEVTKAQRSFSKPPVLGCFTEDTEVLTDSGWKRINLVSASDRVYDGIEFVECDGAIYQGEKHCITTHGVTGTPDHLILVGDDEWIPLKDLNDVNLSRAMSMVNGPYLSMLGAGISSADAPAGVLLMSTEETLGLGKPIHVFPVQTSDSGKRGRGHLSSASPKRIMTDSATEVTLPTAGVGTRITRATESMAGEASPSTSTPSMSTWGILSRFLGGMTPLRKLTAWITQRGIQGVTSGSPIEKETAQTRESTSTSHTEARHSLQPSSGESLPVSTATKAPSPGKSKKAIQQRGSLLNRTGARVPTYDILNAGPRNRFVIRTNKGPIIAHNCGFMLGWKGLIAYSEGYGVDMTEDQAKTAVETFRTMYPEIPKFWQWISDAVKYVTSTGVPLDGYRMRIERDADMLRIWLPSGRALSYYKPEVRRQEAPWSTAERPAFLDNFTYMGMNDKNQWVRISAHAGGLTENIVQSLAGDILWNGIMNATKNELNVVLHVHDEIAVEVKAEFANEALEILKQSMVNTPHWCKDMWLGAAGFITKRYTKD